MATQKKNKKYDWIKLKNEYLTTNISLRGLAEKHGIPWNTVNSRSNKEKWASEKGKVQSKIEADTKQKAINKEIERKTLLNEQHISLYNEGLDVVTELLAVYKATAQQRKKRGNVNPFNLEKIFQCIERAQKGQRLALNMDDEKTEEKEPEINTIDGINISKI